MAHFFLRSISASDSTQDTFAQDVEIFEDFGARPMQNAAMRVLDGIVKEMLKNGGELVKGIIKHGPRTNKCSFGAA